MIESVRRMFSFYVSIILYALFIFFTQWNLSIARMDEAWLHSTLSSLINFIIIPSILVLIFYSFVINFKYFARHKWFTIIFFIMLLFVSIISKSISYTLPLLLGFTGFHADNRKIAKVATISFSLLLIASIFFSILGLNGGDAISKPLFGADDTYTTTAMALGLSNPNSIMSIFFNVIALLLFLCNTKRQTFFASALLLILTVILSAVTGSTTGLIIGFVALLLVSYSKYNKIILKYLRKITPWMFLLITIMTFMFSVNFGSSDDRQNYANSTLTGRPYLWNLRIENGSYVNLFGGNDKYRVINNNGSIESNYPLDNAPLYTLVYFGVIMYLIFLYIFYFGSKNIQEPALVAYIFVAILLMFMEKMELYGLVLIFLQKAITEHHLLNNKKKDIV